MDTTGTSIRRQSIGRFASALNAAERAKEDSSQSFRSFLPPPPSHPQASASSPASPVKEQQPTKVHTDESSVILPSIVQSVPSDLSPPRASKIEKTNIDSSPVQRFNQTTEDVEEDNNELTLQGIKDIVLLKSLGAAEKFVVIIAAVLISIFFFQQYSLKELASLGFQSFKNVASTIYQRHIQELFSPDGRGAVTVGSIMAGAALSIFLDSKPLEIDSLVIRKIFELSTPARHFLEDAVEQFSHAFELVLRSLGVWKMVPAVVRYIAGFLVAIVAVRAALIFIYEKVILAYGQEIALAGMFSIGLLVFCCVTFGLYKAYIWRAKTVKRKTLAIMALKNVILHFLASIGRPEPVSYVHRMLLELEESRKLSGSADNTNASLLLSPSANPTRGSMVEIQIPEDISDVPVKTIWQDLVRVVSADERVLTNVHNINGRNEQCWKYAGGAVVAPKVTNSML